MAVADILISPARVFYAPTGEGLPDENSVAYGAAWGGGWVNVGYTLTPLSIKYQRDTFELEVEQVTISVVERILKDNVTFETTLAEMSASNLALAFGGTVTTTPAGLLQVPKEELEMGGSTALPVYAWGFEGVYQTDAGAQYPVRWFVFRGTAVLNGNIEFSKKAAAGIPLQVKPKADTSKAVGKQMLKFQKVTGTHL